MKKRFSFFLAVFLMCSCFTFHSSDANALGAVWVKEFYKDKFGDKTDEFYLTNKSLFKGTYNNDTVSDGKLGANLIFERDGESLRAYVILLLDGKNQVKNNASSDNKYEVSVKRVDGSQFESVGVMAEGEGRIEVYDSIELANALQNSGGLVKIYIEEFNQANNNYLFAAECGNFNELYSKEILIPFMEEKYQEAEELLRNKQFDAAAATFEELYGYKDSQKRIEEIKEAKRAHTYDVGKTFYFGSYEQDNNISNGKEDIEWIVLRKEDDRIFAISKCALDCKQYNNNKTDVTWETCTLRKWLNEDFLNAAFSSDEQKKILEVQVSADIETGNGISPGNDTKDRVFLLSVQEVKQYSHAQECEPSEYAKAKECYVKDGRCWWWLRSPGSRSNRAAFVDYSGFIDFRSGRPVTNDNIAIRPALWLNLSA